MIRLLRILGFLMIVAGAVVLLTWLIKPLRMVWPWLMALSLPLTPSHSLSLPRLPWTPSDSPWTTRRATA